MPTAVRVPPSLEQNVTLLGRNLAEELAYLLSLSKLPEADQAAILANAQRFTSDQLANLVGVLEAKFADQATQDADQELAEKLKGLKAKYTDVFAATEQMDRAEQELAELGFDLMEAEAIKSPKTLSEIRKRLPPPPLKKGGVKKNYLSV